MEYHRIDYTLLETCLSNAQSKESVGELFLNWWRLSNEISQFRLDCAHPAIKEIATNFNLQGNQDATNLIWTINHLICKSLSEGAENCSNQFPESFNAKLKKLVFKIIVSYESDFKSYYSESFTSLPKLIDLDYRVDVTQYNRKQESMRQPVLKLNLSLEDKHGPEHIKVSHLLQSIITPSSNGNSITFPNWMNSEFAHFQDSHLFQAFSWF